MECGLDGGWQIKVAGKEGERLRIMKIILHLFFFCLNAALIYRILCIVALEVKIINNDKRNKISVLQSTICM